MEAFGTSCRTLYCRQRAYRALQGRACALDEKSRAPLRRRGRRPWDAGILERLLQLRAQMPAIGLEKLHVFLLNWCGPHGLACPNMYGRFALAAAAPGKHAGNATRLRRPACARRPFKPRRVSSRSASQFKAGFTKTVLSDGAARWPTCPNCPKMNARAERFNRCIQEEFIAFHKDLLFDGIHAFNDKLPDCLVCFSEERHHYALNLFSPMLFLVQHQQCNMHWRDIKL